MVKLQISLPSTNLSLNLPASKNLTKRKAKAPDSFHLHHCQVLFYFSYIGVLLLSLYQSSYPFGLWDCQFQESAHISRISFSATPAKLFFCLGCIRIAGSYITWTARFDYIRNLHTGRCFKVFHNIQDTVAFSGSQIVNA